MSGPCRPLGVLLASGPAEGDLPLVLAVSRAALTAGREVEIFLMDDGAAYAVEPALRALLDAGVDIAVCAMDAEARGLDPAVILGLGITLGSQHDHARMVRRCATVLSFT